MSDDVLVRVEGVSKKFCRSLRRSLWYGVQDTAADLLGRGDGAAGLRPEEFWAVDDVSFELKRGECLGLIGRNGAGKTTLLKMLNGLIKPDKGRIEMRGRVGALIALGAGFNPILTGRENIYVNGAVLGLSKREIDAKIDEIIDFAEIGEFIDTPVQSYSSGMQVRLGFAVATAMEPDILLLDEVLAVGDVAFRAKCYTRIGTLMRKAAVILVSHDANTIGQTCNIGLVLERGVSSDGAIAIQAALSRYSEFLPSDGVKAETPESVYVCYPLLDGTARLRQDIVNSTDPVQIEYEFTLADAVCEAVLRATLFSAEGAAIAEWNSLAQAEHLSLSHGRHKVTLSFGPTNLKSGVYEVSVLLADNTGMRMLYLSHRGLRLRVKGVVFGQAPVQLGGYLQREDSICPEGRQKPFVGTNMSSYSSFNYE